ncbi:MAG TPA: hypothetical protein VF438_03835 [Candidatus Paceibacterota bacterium]
MKSSLKALGILVVVLGIIAVIVFLVAGQPQQSGDTTNGASTTTTGIDSSPTSTADLTLHDVQNAAYNLTLLSYKFLPEYATTTLINGMFSDNAAMDYPGAIDFYHYDVAIANVGQTPLVAFGDLNNDGVGDAVVLLAARIDDRLVRKITNLGDGTNPTATSTDVILAAQVLIQNAHGPQFVASFFPNVSLEQGKANSFKSLQISNGQIQIASGTTTARYELIDSAMIVAVSDESLDGVDSTVYGGWERYVSTDGAFDLRYPPHTFMNAVDGGMRLTVATSTFPALTTVSSVTYTITARSTINTSSCIPTEWYDSKGPSLVNKHMIGGYSFYEGRVRDYAMGSIFYRDTFGFWNKSMCYTFVNEQHSFSPGRLVNEHYTREQADAAAATNAKLEQEFNRNFMGMIQSFSLRDKHLTQ